MKRLVAIAGWLVFAGSIGGAVFSDRPDDPLTAALKARGWHRPALAIVIVVLAAVLVWLAREIWLLVRLRRLVDQQNRELMLAERSMRNRDNHTP